MRRAGRGLRAGSIVGQFNTTRLLLRVAVSVIVLLQDDLLAERIETGVSAVDFDWALMISPTVELSSRTDFRRPGLAGGVPQGEDNMNA